MYSKIFNQTWIKKKNEHVVFNYICCNIVQNIPKDNHLSQRKQKYEINIQIGPL